MHNPRTIICPNKENFSKPRPTPLQSPSTGYYPYSLPYFPSSSQKSRSPFSTKTIPQINQTLDISCYDIAQNSSRAAKKNQEIGLSKEDDKNIQQLLEAKTKECEELKKKLCDERVEHKISKKKLDNYERKIKELLGENEKLNKSLNKKLEKASQSAQNTEENRQTINNKDLMSRIKALSTENERLFKENEILLSEIQETKGETMREISEKEALIKEKDEALLALKSLESQLEQYKGKTKELENELLQSHVCINDLEKKLKAVISQQQENSNLNSSCLNMSRREDEVKGLKMIILKYKEEGTKVQEIIENRRKEMELVKKELDRVKRENRKLLKQKIEWEENLDKERKEKDEYKELIENQSVILREKELELDERLIEIDEIKRSFLDISQMK